MSASLVGSEMCIRDRSTPAGFAPAPVAAPLPAPAPAQAWVLARVRAGAVSYTHLTLPTICSV
eukprot:5136825-Alexandrium_andersonii.AAC.1